MVVLIAAMFIALAVDDLTLLPEMEYTIDQHYWNKEILPPQEILDLGDITSDNLNQKDLPDDLINRWLLATDAGQEQARLSSSAFQDQGIQFNFYGTREPTNETLDNNSRVLWNDVVNDMSERLEADGIVVPVDGIFPRFENDFGQATPKLTGLTLTVIDYDCHWVQALTDKHEELVPGFDADNKPDLIWLSKNMLGQFEVTFTGDLLDDNELWKAMTTGEDGKFTSFKTGTDDFLNEYNRKPFMQWRDQYLLQEENFHRSARSEFYKKFLSCLGFYGAAQAVGIKGLKQMTSDHKVNRGWKTSWVVLILLLLTSAFVSALTGNVAIIGILTGVSVLSLVVFPVFGPCANNEILVEDGKLSPRTGHCQDQDYENCSSVRRRLEAIFNESS